MTPEADEGATAQPVLFDLLQPAPELTGASFTSFYLTMRDGVRIAIDLWLPASANESKVSTAVRSTRYWRSHVGAPLVEQLGAVQVSGWMEVGFALVQVDARGTGASFGSWPRAWERGSVGRPDRDSRLDHRAVMVRCVAGIDRPRPLRITEDLQHEP